MEGPQVVPRRDLVDVAPELGEIEPARSVGDGGVREQHVEDDRGQLGVRNREDVEVPLGYQALEDGVAQRARRVCG